MLLTQQLFQLNVPDRMPKWIVTTAKHSRGHTISHFIFHGSVLDECQLSVPHSPTLLFKLSPHKTLFWYHCGPRGHEKIQFCTQSTGLLPPVTVSFFLPIVLSFMERSSHFCISCLVEGGAVFCMLDSSCSGLICKTRWWQGGVPVLCLPLPPGEPVNLGARRGCCLLPGSPRAFAYHGPLSLWLLAVC